MKNTLSILLILLVSNSWVYAQEKGCARTTYFGEVPICLPQIKGYQECYPDSIVKQLADATEAPANSVLGFYLNNPTYDNKDSIGLINFDNYFKLYGTKQIQDYRADPAFLKEMQGLLSGNFISKNWDVLKEEIDKVGLEIEVGVPVVIKNYSLNKKSFTYLLLTKYEIPEREAYTMAIAISGLLINERLVWMAYYLNYEGEATIAKLQQNSNSILRRVLKAN